MTQAREFVPTRTVGFWMAVPLAALQAVNVARAASDPAAFAIYMGAPLSAGADAAWVLVYAARTGFIALLVTALLIRRDLAALKWTALVALVMPLADAWITHRSGAPMSIVGRHLAIAAYVALATIALFASDRGRAR